MKTKLTKKLPKARVMFYSDCANPLSGMRYDKNEFYDSPVACIPCHTAAQARAIVKAAPFLTLPPERQMVVLALAIADNPEDTARACLRAMGLGGGK